MKLQALKRSHKRMDPDLKALKVCATALFHCSERMRRPTLEFLWDKYVLEPQRPKVKP